MLDRELALYRQLQSRGVGIEFVTYGDRGDLTFADAIPGLQIYANIEGVKLSSYERKVVGSSLMADVYKSNQIAGADIGLLAARKAKKKFIARCGYLLSEIQYNKYGPKSKQAKHADKLENKVFSEADQVAVTTQRIADVVANKYGVKPETINVIPNYVETDRFSPASNRQVNPKLRIGFVGRLDNEKNLFQFIRAIIDFDVEVWLVGYGPQQDQLEEFSEGGRAQVKFLGAVPNKDLPGLLQQCDLFALPSLYEGHPKALIEAMACGLPVLGTRVTGIQEIISDGQNGVLCETDAASLREGVRRLLDDEELRTRVGKAGREYVQTHFALDRVVDLEMNLLKRLTG